MFGLGARKKQAITSTVFTAIPLAGCPHFTFGSLDEFEKKFAKISSRCEELEIDLYDEGFPGAAKLWEIFSKRFGMAQMAAWYDRVEGLRPEEHAALFHALEYKGFDDLDDALRWVDEEGRPFEGDVKAFAENLAEDQGADFYAGPLVAAHFDYEAFGRDLKFDLDPDDEDQARQLDMDDRELGEEYVDSMGGVEELGKETAARYFDWDSFARDMELSGDVVEFDFAGQTWTIWAND